jgi:hypothetical protein
MIGMTRLIAGKVRFNFENLDGPVGAWIDTVFGPLKAEPHVEAATEITFRFVDSVPKPAGRLWPVPIGQTDQGLWFGDHLERGALMSFPLTDNDILVERDIDPWFFQRWLYFPLLRASLWQHRICLVHAAGVTVNNKRVAISGWTGAGKSPIALDLLERGSGFISDDWFAMSAEGVVSPISAQLNLNSHHQPYIDPARWPGSSSNGVQKIAKGAKAASRSMKKWPKVSMGFARVADVASAAGKVKVPVNQVFPDAKVSESGPLDTFVFVPRQGTNVPSVDAIPEALAASGRSELMYCEDFESAIRFSYPGLLTRPLFASLTEEMEVIASGMSMTTKLIAGQGDVPRGVKDLASHIEEATAGADGRTAVA